MVRRALRRALPLLPLLSLGCAHDLYTDLPPWIQEGGFEASLERLRDPELRARIVREMNEESDEWENLYLGAGTPENILLVGFKKTKEKTIRKRNKEEEEESNSLLLLPEIRKKES